LTNSSVLIPESLLVGGNANVKNKSLLMLAYLTVPLQLQKLYSIEYNDNIMAKGLKLRVRGLLQSAIPAIA